MGSDIAVVLGGGGARAAYQVGVLRAIARERPEFRFPIITGVSAGGINAAFLGAVGADCSLHPVDQLTELWMTLRMKDVFETDSLTASRIAMSWLKRLASGGRGARNASPALLDTSPLREFLGKAFNARADGSIPGVEENIQHGALDALALTTLNYTTGQTITWVQGREIETWERPNRRSIQTPITIEHVMASAALPILFPAVQIGASWYGDGGVRLSAPLSPALHLGARRMLVISTRYNRSFEEADIAETPGYPPPAQILGQLVKAIFLDVIDQDVLRVELINSLLENLEPDARLGLSPIRLVVVRPSEDLGVLAAGYEKTLPPAFRYMTRGLGSRETRSADFLSMLMFEPEFMMKLIDLGENDADAQMEEILGVLDEERPAEQSRMTGG
ncbi:MAG: patatin-like phospholipase family protein [Acidobacteria bacterium]|nr:patatin-like phospholipase family protein [Acidobacteriota bacterium]